MDVFLSFDVERHSFETNTHDNSTGADSVIKRIENDAMPRLLGLLAEFNAKATFFSTAIFAKNSPKTIQSIVRAGHEVACHGYDHDDYYDALPLEKQVYFLQKSKSIIEEAANIPLVSFRAPALRINKDTMRALESAAFLFDSSVSSQRFDGPFTSGAIKKLKWLTANRKPYHPNYSSPYKKGDSSITEVPVSAMGWPFISTHLRIAPTITFAIQELLMLEADYTHKPLVFLMHPQEVLFFQKGKISNNPNARKTNYFSGQLRHALKFRNLGDNCFELFRKVLHKCQQHNANFKTIKEVSL